MAETESVPHHNGIDTIAEEEECNKTRPADIEADMREMERRKRVEAIMNSRLFREELERIVDGQIREGGPSSILQQLSEVMGVPAARIGSVFKSSNCVVPINDIRGMEAMGYEKGEKILRCKLAATFRLIDLYGWAKGIGSLITARLNADQELFLVNPYGVLNHEITASSLNKINMQGQIVEQGTTNFGVNTSQFTLHSVIHAARPDIRCAIYVGCNSVVAVSALKQGLLPLTKDAALLGELSVHNYTGALYEPEEKDKLLRSLGPVSKVLLLSNHGAICCGETVEETFYAVNHIVAACEAQLKLMPVGLDNLILIPEETRKAIYDASRKPPEGIASAVAVTDNKERTQVPKWRVGGAEYEALMRMLDNAGFRTGYIYRNPLVKNDLPKPKNDVEVPPAVSSLGYLIEEEELFKQGIWKKGDFRKGGDRSRWLNSPNVYQKVEVLETGTPDPKKITKWVAEASPTHSSTPVKIDCALQFVPPNTNPKEFKRIQQQIKDYRRADKISAGPQSHILEGVSWDEANRLKDANVSATGDHVVLMGAASKGIIQRGYQHNATVYKAPYAKNPFDSVTDDELNEYKKTVEKKRHGDYTDTDFSESEALSSLQISDKPKNQPMSPPSQSEPETDTAAEHQVLRIETKQVPKPSQPEVVLSDEAEEQKRFDLKTTTFAEFLSELRSSKNSVGTDSLQLMNTSPRSSVVLEWGRERDASSLLARMPLTASVASRSYALSTQSFIHLAATVGNLPYRTNNFFGFLTPRRMPWIHHFHIPVLPPRYSGRSRSTSLNDVFATERFLSMTNDGLKQTIRRKLHFEQTQPFAVVAPSPPSFDNPFRNPSEFDFEIQLEQDHNNNNLERMSEVCEAHLQNVRSTQQQGSFIGKLDDMQYSKPGTPESCTVYSEVLLSENSLLNHTRELFSDAATASSLNLDEKEWTILEKIDNYSLTYGTLPEVYTKIGEEILNRTNYDAINVQTPNMMECDAPEASTAGLAQEDRREPADDFGTDPTIERSSSVSPKRLNGRKRATPATLNKRTKNRRNRNFIQENIERVKTKQYSSPNPSRSSKSSKTVERKTPLTAKQFHSATRKIRRHTLKRRSLQFNSDHDGDDDDYLSQLPKVGNDHSDQQQLKVECDQQTQCIAKIGDSLSQMQNDVNEIVQLQGQIDEARATHLELMTKATLEDCRRVNSDPASSEYAADEE